MLLQVHDTLFQCFQVLCAQIGFRNAAVIFQCADSRNQYYGIGSKTRLTALDVEEFFSTQICAETGFRDAILCHLHGCLGGSYGVTSMSDVSKGTTMYQCRSMF